MLGQRLDPNDDDAEESGWELCLVVNDRDPATLVWVVLRQKEIISLGFSHECSGRRSGTGEAGATGV